MATVYVAEDLKHRRKVALKVLHPELAAVVGADRFLREIEIAARLNNPHILPLHDSGHADGLLYYVMPFVEGESLRDRLTRERQLPVDDALRIAREVAAALAYAHSVGVIHRDIKPENIMLAGSEAVVTDFGIARAITSAGDNRLTETGMSLGTPHYISPEQASGDPHVDQRSDIYSLGCVLFEMLAGEPPFTGPTVQAIVAKVLTDHAPDLTRLRNTVSPGIARVVAKALAKLPADRFASAAEFSEALTRESVLSADRQTALSPALVLPTARRRVSARDLMWPALAAAATIAAAAGWYRAGQRPEAQVIEFQQSLDSGYTLARGFPPLAVSPDGKSIVFAVTRGGISRLELRHLNQRKATVIPGTEGAHTPFFSPDGLWIGFVGQRAIYRLPVSGGAPLKVTEAPFVSLGADWGADGNVVFGGVGSGLYIAPASGGVATSLTAPNGARGETAHALPHFTPDGKHLLFTVNTGDGPRAALLTLESRTWQLLDIGEASGARYVPSGHLLYALSNHLVATLFDIGSRAVSGSPITVIDSVFSATAGTFVEFSYFSTSPGGTMAFVPGGVTADFNLLMWSDRGGKTAPASDVRGLHYFPHLSPDGRYIAVQEGVDLWTYDTRRGTRARITSGGGTDPAWRPDGTGFAFATSDSGTADLYYGPSDGSAPPTLLYGAENPVFPHSWSPDGKALAFYEVSPKTARDIWILTREGDRASASQFLVTPFNERSPAFSPNGKWVAYVSDEPGRDEVFIRPYPGPGQVWSVSTTGGREPVWSRDGRELYYRHADQVMAVTITDGASLSIGPPRPLFGNREDIYFAPSGSQSYDVGPDGRFIMTQADASAAPTAVNVAVNWLSDLQRRVPR
jgi:serine/threonine-protein kinase